MNYYIYDKQGNLLITKLAGTEEQFKREFPDIEIYVSNIYLGEKAIIENGKVRAITRLDLILTGEMELSDGEYIKGSEIITVEKPDVFHTWDKNKWIYSKDLEVDFINSEILNKETDLNDLYDTLDKATARRLKALIADTQGKIDKIIEELETLENKLKELEG